MTFVISSLTLSLVSPLVLLDISQELHNVSGSKWVGKNNLKIHLFLSQGTPWGSCENRLACPLQFRSHQADSAVSYYSAKCPESTSLSVFMLVCSRTFIKNFLCFSHTARSPPACLKWSDMLRQAVKASGSNIY